MSLSPNEAPEESSTPECIPIAKLAEVFNDLRSDAVAIGEELDDHLLEHIDVDVTKNPSPAELARFAIGERAGLRKALFRIATVTGKPLPKELDTEDIA